MRGIGLSPGGGGLSPPPPTTLGDLLAQLADSGATATEIRFSIGQGSPDEIRIGRGDVYLNRLTRGVGIDYLLENEEAERIVTKALATSPIIRLHDATGKLMGRMQ